MRGLIVAAAMIAISAPAFAQTAPAGEYVLDKPHASLQWKGMHQGLSWYAARFTKFDIQLTFDPADVTKSKVTATIDPKSVETDYEQTRPANRSDDFNAELADGERFFNSGKHPKITFVSTAITKTGDKTGKMTGNLTFLGVTKPVTLDVTFNGAQQSPRPPQKFKVGFTATGAIDRTQFGMASGGSMANEIRLEINAEFTQK